MRWNSHVPFGETGRETDERGTLVSRQVRLTSLNDGVQTAELVTPSIDRLKLALHVRPATR